MDISVKDSLILLILGGVLSLIFSTISIIIFIALFVDISMFIGTPLYGLLNGIYKIKKKISEKLFYNMELSKVICQYELDTVKELNRMENK